MADIMAQPGLGLTAPTSRQDIISALLNDYGNSFGRGDASSSDYYSPVPALKELPLPPPPPPRSDSIKIDRKPLPAVQRMNMKFQLRDEDGPSSPDSPDSPATKPTRRIVSRSLSREGKPPSLKLTISNGTTATIPPTPVQPSQVLPSSQSVQDKELPPPPPEKSERRHPGPVTMGSDFSQFGKDLGRNDSLLSNTQVSNETSNSVEASPVVKRKALPENVVKRFKSLAELGKGPRGGKGGPLPRTSASSKASVDSDSPEILAGQSTVNTEAPDNSRSNSSDVTVTPENAHQQVEAPTNNQLPPTPDEDQNMVPLAPPKKALTAIGLPSNPRSKTQTSPTHKRGNSSISFGGLQPHRPAPPIPTASLTPEMTPPPQLRPVQPQKDGPISPFSPLPPPKDQTRPVSYETGVETQERTIAEHMQPTTTAEAASITASKESPVRPTSLDLASPSPKTESPMVAALAPAPALVPAAQCSPISIQTSEKFSLSQFPTVPSHPSAQEPAPAPAPDSAYPAAPQLERNPKQERELAPASHPEYQQPAGSPPPFTPLTRHPCPLPPSLIPPITNSHLTCYTAHAISVWSNNALQSLGCMLCHKNDPERKWTCSWCNLRICWACSEELKSVPGRDLRVLVERRKEVGDADAGDGSGNGVVESGRGTGMAQWSREEEGEAGDVVGIGFDGRFAG